MTNKQRAARECLRPVGAGIAIAIATPFMLLTTVASAGSFPVGDALNAHYTVTLGYAAAMRAQSASSRLIDGPIDPGTGLPTTVNSDDGNRNFDSGSLVNNRASVLGELYLTGRGFGFVARGDAFYDHAYRGRNDNDSPATVNKDGEHDRFTDEARRYNGRRARLLDAYAYADWRLSDDVGLNVRAGRQVVAWGESLFFSGVASAQGPADATKANIPGAELKTILLPVEQVSAQLSLGHRLSLLGYYRLRFKASELEPVGSFFSTTDVVGPGAQFLSLGPGFDMPRGADREPSDHGQWGLGLRYQVTAATNIGAYVLRYHNPNPQVTLDFTNMEYNVFHADGIRMGAISFSSRLGPTNIAGEVSYRDRMDLLVDSPMGPTVTRGGMSQALVSALYTMSPNPISRQIDLIGEIGVVRVHSVDALPDGSDQLSADRSAWGYSGTATFNYPNVIPRWDLAIPLTVSGIEGGTPAMAGAFGGNFGRADRRASIGANFVYLQAFEVGVAYNAFFGSPDLDDRPLADRDHVALNLKYTF